MKRSRKLIFPLFLLFLLFGCTSLIFDFIYKYPVTYIFDKIVWSIPVRVLFVVVVCLLLVWKQFTWIKNAYIMSQNQRFAYGFAMLLFVFARYGDDWSFLKIKAGSEIVKWHWQPLIYDIKLIDILWLSMIYPLVALFKQKRKLDNGSAFFEEDLPLKDSEKKHFPYDKESQKVKDSENENKLRDEESQQYNELSKVLIPKLVDQKFQKAFSIGIIGPYGNGKSSLVNHLRDKFAKELKPQRFEIIEFLPAYSHKPEQISTDFFTILASQLKKYHGSLNQSMLSYAAKLIELGLNGKKDIQGLLKPADWFTENKSASQAYDELKKIFTQIDIKTIVIIDDVDRLGKEEILEVLRLIRNTANFPNTIFIVAYDKDYVIKTIGQDLMYLDKYFQYELFVPPHRREDLLRSFAKMVLSKQMGVDIEKLKKVINQETLNKTLLDKFVLNYRDVKVLANIYCMNLCLLTEEVDYIDLLHFTLMNRHFPKQVRFIYNNFEEFFIAKNMLNKPLELKKHNPFKGEITIASFIEDLNIENDSHYLFKRLLLSLFGLKDDPKPDPKISSAEIYKDKVNYYSKPYKGVYYPDKELSIRNADRSHLYFEVLVRKDEISNVQFSLKIGTDEFQDYILELLKNVIGQENENLKERIKNKLEYYHEKLDSKIKLENAIKVAPSVSGDLAQILFYHVKNYKHIYEGCFENKNDFIEFFKVKLWNNEDLEAKYVIQTILKLVRYVNELKSDVGESNISVPPYIGLTEEEVKLVLIKKAKQVIQECENVDYIFLVWLSGVLDSTFIITDEDINFSKFLYDNDDQLFEYLRIVEKLYVEGFDFSSAIFKVFTDKNKFEKECFGLEVSKDKKILIREFHHLLELHDIRKGAVNLSEFTPFYCFNMKLVQFNSSEYKQTIYVQKTGDFKLIFGNPDLSEYSIYAQDIGNDRVIIEGHKSYEELLERIIPPNRLNDINAYLSEKEDEFEILSIQTPEQIKESIIPYCKYNRMIEELKVNSSDS